MFLSKVGINNKNDTTDAARLLINIASIPHFNFKIRKTFRDILKTILMILMNENNFAFRSRRNFKKEITALASKNKISAERMIR
jgi:hypothetical protein